MAQDRLYRSFSMATNLRLWDASRGIVFASSRTPSPIPGACSSRTVSTVVPTSSADPPDVSISSTKTAVKVPRGRGRQTTVTSHAAQDEAPDVIVGNNKPNEAEAEIPTQLRPSTLDWEVSEELFRAAQKAAPGTPESFWSYTLYRRPGENGEEEKVKVHYCRSKFTSERVCQQHFMNEKVLGFDLEWAADAVRSSGVRRNVSLIQLASPSRIALFHAAVFPKGDGDNLVPPSFKKIMEDDGITKVGVWIKGDATKLRTHMGIESRGLMELSHLYRLVTYSRSGRFKDINKRLIPLATQVQQYLHLPMFKGQDVRSSDWTKALNMNQIKYSASDAYAGVQLFAALEHHRKQLDPCPPRPHYAELDLPIRLADGIDLDTSSDEETTEANEEASPSPAALTPAARRRQLKIYLKSLKESTTSLSKAMSQAAAAIQPSKEPIDSRVEAAEAWVAAFKADNHSPTAVRTTSTTSTVEDDEATPAATTNPRALRSELRAYHLWHHEGMVPDEVAKVLRNPPLQTQTVEGYIHSAVTKERLEINGERFVKEVLAPRFSRPQHREQFVGRAMKMVEEMGSRP